jgi:hypothetical protein
MTRYRGRLTEPEMGTEEAREAGCTCGWTTVHPTDIDPPEPKLDPWCPVHGRDPDYEMERRRDDAREAARDIEEDRAEDYLDD